LGLEKRVVTKVEDTTRADNPAGYSLQNVLTTFFWLLDTFLSQSNAGKAPSLQRRNSPAAWLNTGRM